MNRRNLPPKLSQEILSTYEDVINKIQFIGDMDQEAVILITMNYNRIIIGEHFISLGTMEEAVIDYRILLNRIISDKASRFIMAHNHVTGVAIFSPADFISTAHLKYVCRVLNLDFMDELLFAHGREPASMVQRHPKFWNTDFFDLINKDMEKYIPKMKG